MINKEFLPFEPSEQWFKALRIEFRSMQKAADLRGNEWGLSFEEFVELWRPHWRERRRMNLVLCRNGYIGPWALGNVRIDTRSSQVSDQHALMRRLGVSWIYHPQTGRQLASADDLINDKCPT
jgi:hypothetical protein